MENEATYAILHHTADSATGPQLKKVDAYHKLRFGMLSRLGYYVGYHYFIERSGSITKCRGHDEEGAHTKGKNLESIGIAIAGNFDNEAPSEAQRQAVFKLQEDLSAQYGVTEFPVYYHFKYADTHCPGFYFQGNEWKVHILKQQITFLTRLLIWLKSLFQNQ